MDVRCDRCETEYELDDAIVTDAGASVQCTTCGHTFIVTRPASAPLPTAGITPPSGITEPVGPNVPEWTLSADDGKVHRFRDLNTLQKWIVERKVTRFDRISRSGGPWLALGDVVELAPFFSVVDEADRARSSTTGSTAPSPGAIGTVRSRTASGQFRSTSVSTPPPVPIEPRPPISEDGPTVPNRPLPGFAAGAVTPAPGIRRSEPRAAGAGVPDARPSVGSAASTGGSRPVVGAPRAPARTELVFGPNITEESRALETDFLRPSKTGRNVVIGLCAVALLAGGGYWWWARQQGQATSQASGVAPAPTVGTGPATAADSKGPGVGSPPAATPGGGTEGAATGKAAGSTGSNGGSAAAPSSAGAGTEGGTPSGGANGKVGIAAAGSGGSAGAPAGVTQSGNSTGAAGGSGGAPARVRGVAASVAAGRDGRPSAEGGTGKPGSYDRLVADADRLLDRGKSAKADKLYAQALAARPDGVAALTGSAYVLLDRQRHFKAIETFRRALAIQPGFGPALFGIAESYRARGDTAQALAAYRQYLSVSPSGADAPAARRQIKDLESGAPPASANERSSSATPSADKDQ